MNHELNLTVTDEDVGERLDSFIGENIEEFSRSFLKKHIISGGVRLNNKPAKPGVRLRFGDIIQIDKVTTKIPDILAENIEVNILYEDDFIIVVDKPKGMVVHPAPGHYEKTLVNALLYHCAGKLSGINGNLRPGIVHRIDMDTSGVLVVAKNDIAHKSLSAQFANHSINRVYEALCRNIIKDDFIDINKPIGRSPKDRKKMAVTEKNSKPAITHIKILERFKGATFIEARLETGRTHQIRVHMSHMGHPLIGDTIYGSNTNHYGQKGQALFAKLLGFSHPATNSYMEFRADRPEYFEELLSNLRKVSFN